MNFYLTFNDAPSGVYNSQVIDVVNFLNRHGVSTRLIAFISLRSFRTAKRKIVSRCPEAIVLPMFPGVRNWYLNRFLLLPLLLIRKPESVMARGIFSTRLADYCRKFSLNFKLIFDARGAYFAEFSEHRLIDDEAFIAQIEQLEEKALRRSDAQLAVSRALVKYWREQYHYNAGGHVSVIPCTLPENQFLNPIGTEKRCNLRKENGIAVEDVVLVYSGSAAGWQSLDELFAGLSKVMQSHENIRLILLTPMPSLAGTPLEPFSNRIILKWVSPEEVPEYLAMADYGLLLRSESQTNRVASPTKFAEYLASGLKVLISPQIGDFSDFVIEHNCGEIVSENQFPALQPLNETDREHVLTLAESHFRKPRFLDQYLELIQPD